MSPRKPIRRRRAGPAPEAMAAAALAAALALGADRALAELRLPPVPPGGAFTRDYAELLSVRADNRIGQLQRQAFEQHDTQIVVVTVPSMARYGGEGYSIERFASEWFNAWQIGKRGRGGELINRGILLLISSGDRQGRIELGVDWGRSWDAHCARVMEERMVPQFRQGDYSAGIEAGVEALAEMASQGPETSPPLDLDRALRSQPVKTSPFPMWIIGLMVAGGVGLIVLSFFMPEHRKWLLISGIGLVVAGLLTWVILAALVVFLKARGRGSRRGWFSSGGGFSGGGGFSSRGGFSSGGFSGGGGASGRW